MDEFLGWLRLKKQAIEAMADLEPFRSGGSPFAPMGATPSRSICWGEAGGYKTIAEKVLDGIVRDLNASAPGAGNNFHNQVKNAFDVNALGFYAGNTAAHEHLRFVAESEAKLIDSYIRPSTNSMASQLVRTLTDFCPVYTDLLLTNVPKLQTIVCEITKLFDPESKPQPVSVSGLPMYLGALVTVAFCSKAPSAAIAYIGEVTRDNPPLRYRIMSAPSPVPPAKGSPTQPIASPVPPAKGPPTQPIAVVSTIALSVDPPAPPLTAIALTIGRCVACGGQFKGTAGLNTHQRSCKVLQAITLALGTCSACGGQYKGETGLKIHQKSCQQLRAVEDEELISGAARMTLETKAK